MPSAAPAPAARMAVRLCKSARKFRIAERTATAVLPVPPATFCAASRILRIGLHLRLGSHTAHSFGSSSAQLALSLRHAANIARRGLGGDDFFFRPLAGQICPTARVLRRIGQRAALGLFRADTALTGGVGAGVDDFSLLCGAALPVFFNLLAGKLSPLLYGEIGVLLDSRIGCISQHRSSVLGRGIVALPCVKLLSRSLVRLFSLASVHNFFITSFGILPAALLFDIRSAGFSLISFMAFSLSLISKVPIICSLTLCI